MYRTILVCCLLAAGCVRSETVNRGSAGDGDGAGDPAGMGDSPPGGDFDIPLPPSAVVKSIGSGKDFPSINAWETARQGDLTTRLVLRVTPLSGVFLPEEAVMSPECSGTYVPEDATGLNNNSMTLDTPTGACAVGATLTGQDSTATAQIDEVLITGGTIEVGHCYNGFAFTDNVVVDGSTTDADHYMWLTTPRTERHAGLAGTGARIEPAEAGHGVHVRDDYFRLEGLEITGWSRDFAGNYAGVLLDANEATLVALIIYDDDVSTGEPDSDGVRLRGTNVTGHVKNTLIYETARSSLRSEGTDSVLRINNSTVWRCNERDSTDTGCIAATGNGVIDVSNTIAMHCGEGDCFGLAGGGRFGVVQHNLSDDDTAPGPNSIINARATSNAQPGTSTGDAWVVFESHFNETDFHLKAVAANAALGAGAVLTGQDTLDVDGEARVGEWDLGFDQARRPIAPAVVAPDSDEVSVESAVVRQDCAAAVNCFPSLSAWALAFGGIDFGPCPVGDLACAKRIASVQIEGQWTSSDSEPVRLEGWVTSETTYITIATVGASRHLGVAGSGYVLRPNTAAHGIYIQANYTRVEGIEITRWSADSGGSWDAISVRGNHVVLDRLLIHEDGHGIVANSDANGINLESGDGTSLSIYNSIIYDVARDGIVDWEAQFANVTIENCTLYECTVADNAASSHGCITLSHRGSVFHVRNVLAFDTDVAAQAFNQRTSVSQTSWGSSTTNVSSDASAPGSNPAIDQVASDYFVSVGGSVDLRLGASSPAIDTGVTAPNAPAFDIEDNPRPQGTGWDKGADER